jgi:hypothetical protein
MVAVFWLDEACNRGYLHFTPELRDLFESWGIAQQYASAYSTQSYGFCLRRVLNEFAYVWITLLLLMALWNTSGKLLCLLPSVSALRDKLGFCSEQPPEGSYQATLEHAREAQSQLTKSLSNLLVISSFGPLVPPLMVLSSGCFWLQMRTAVAVRMQDRRFGSILAENVMVQVPSRRFQLLQRVMVHATAFATFADLRFDYGPIVLYVTVAIAEVAIGQKIVQTCMGKYSCAGQKESNVTTVEMNRTYRQVSSPQFKMQVDDEERENSANGSVRPSHVEGILWTKSAVHATNVEEILWTKPFEHDFDQAALAT